MKVHRDNTDNCEISQDKYFPEDKAVKDVENSMVRRDAIAKLEGVSRGEDLDSLRAHQEQRGYLLPIGADAPRFRRNWDQAGQTISLVLAKDVGDFTVYQVS